MSKSPENSVKRYGVNAVSSVLTQLLRLTVLVWGQLEGGFFELYEMVPGVLAAAGAILLLHHMAPGPDCDAAARQR